MRSEEEVVYIDAAWIVAAMEHAEARRNRPVGQLPRQPMGANDRQSFVFAVDLDMAAARRDAALHFPAATWLFHGAGGQPFSRCMRAMAPTP